MTGLTAEQKRARRRWARDYQKRNAELGLCVTCGEKATVGLMCAAHAKANSRKSLRFQEERRLQGLCTRCGKESFSTWLCPRCQAKKSDQARAKKAQES